MIGRANANNMLQKRQVTIRTKSAEEARAATRERKDMPSF